MVSPGTPVALSPDPTLHVCAILVHFGQNTSHSRGNTTVPKTQKPAKQHSVQNKPLILRALLLFWIVALTSLG